MRNCYYVKEYEYTMSGMRKIGSVLRMYDGMESKDPSRFFMWIANEIMDIEVDSKITDIVYMGHHFKYVGLEPGMVFCFMKENGVVKKFRYRKQ